MVLEAEVEVLFEDEVLLTEDVAADILHTKLRSREDHVVLGNWKSYDSARHALVFYKTGGFSWMGLSLWFFRWR